MIEPCECSPRRATVSIFTQYGVELHSVPGRCPSQPTCVCRSAYVSSTSLPDPLKHRLEELGMFLMMLIRPFQHRKQRVAFQPGVSAGVQQIFPRNRFGELQEPAEPCAPVAVHARPGLVAVLCVQPGVQVVRLALLLRVELL